MVLVQSQIVFQPYIPGSGVSAFDGLGSPEGVAMLMGLHGGLPFLDTLSIDLCTDAAAHPLMEHSRRLVYRRS